MNWGEIKAKIKKYKDSNTFEYNRVMKVVSQNVSAQGAILDVGCGFGRYLKPLSKMHKTVVGVEANAKTAQKLRSEGLTVYSPEEFEKKDLRFDAIIMSHFIEHFAPSDLLSVMDRYLDTLRPGGILIIATPLLSQIFYVNFDHVRPYLPQSIEEVFGGSNLEVQYYARNTVRTEKVWFRRSRLQITTTSLLFNNNVTKNICYALNVLLSYLFRVSFSLIGYRSGWIGVFKKI